MTKKGKFAKKGRVTIGTKSKSICLLQTRSTVLAVILKTGKKIYFLRQARKENRDQQKSFRKELFDKVSWQKSTAGAKILL